MGPKAQTLSWFGPLLRLVLSDSHSLALINPNLESVNAVLRVTALERAFAVDQSAPLPHVEGPRAPGVGWCRDPLNRVLPLQLRHGGITPVFRYGPPNTLDSFHNPRSGAQSSVIPAPGVTACSGDSRSRMPDMAFPAAFFARHRGFFIILPDVGKTP
jgi:hypothetical protein